MSSIKNICRNAISPLLFYSGYYDFLLNRTKNRAVILTYHKVSNFTGEEGFHCKFDIGVSKNNFLKQMEFISRKMNPLPINDIVDCLDKNMRIPDKSVALTFDDGYQDNYINAYPVLKRYNIPATIFLTTGYIETQKIFWWEKIIGSVKKTNVPCIDLKVFKQFKNKGPVFFDTLRLKSNREKDIAIDAIMKFFKSFDHEMINQLLEILQDKLKVGDKDIRCPEMLTWAQVKEMSNNGIEFGAHTVTHPDLSSLMVDKVENELKLSRKVIEEKTNKPVYGFAYPYGLKSNFNDKAREIIKSMGFRYACTAETGITTHDSDTYGLKRISMPNHSLPSSFWKIFRVVRKAV